MNNDLISRNALIQHAFTAEFDGKPIDVVALVDVDNAPTVTPLFNIQEELDEDICKEFLNKRCLSVIPQETLIMLQLACGKTRPKGEWKVKTISTFPQYQPDEYICPFCNTIVNYKTNFCPNCGADMRGAE